MNDATMAVTGDAEALRLVHLTTVPYTLRFTAGHAAHMRRYGIRTWAVSSPGTELDDFGRAEGVEVAAVPMQRRVTPGADLVALWRLLRVLRRVRPHIVDAHSPKAGLLGMIASWLSRVPVRIYHLHGLPLITTSGATRRILGWSERVACRLATHVYAVSDSVRDYLVEERLCPADRISVLGRGSISGVDARGAFEPRGSATERPRVRAALGIDENAPVILFVGRIVGDKGVPELMRAWRDLRAAFADAHLVLTGPFEERDAVPQSVRDAIDTDERVHATGMIADPVKYYAAADVVALPSHREGFPVVALEAAAMGLPIVATRAQGCVDAVVDGVTGTLVPVGDADALRDALRRYLRDPELRVRHGRAARERALRDYRPEDLLDALAREYRRHLEARTPGRLETVQC